MWSMALRAPTRSSAAVAAVALLRASRAHLPWPAPGLLAVTPYVVVLAADECRRSFRAGRHGSASLAGAAALALGAPLLRRATGAPEPAAPGSRVLRIVSANVLEGQASVPALAALIAAEQPDVLLLQEADAPFRARLAAAGAAAELPHAVEAATTALWSRWPLERPAAKALEHRAESVAANVCLAGGRPVPMLSPHPWPPILPQDVAPWQRLLAALPGPGPGSPLEGGIIAGDLNSSLDQAEFRAVLGRGWKDAAASAGRGLLPTIRSGVWLATIDHVLVPPDAVVLDYRTANLPGSDHRALIVGLALPA